ncbi:MAG TPA: glycosyl hydrolase family 28-related protein [Rhizomicrobium sp.]|nr:glycosyl hydrolase family 28-related protein [Rhizomicrobium sp.]
MKCLLAAALLIFAGSAVAQSGPLSPRDFGAIGDGKADDTAALKKWLSALAQAGMGYCGSGNYRVRDSLVQPPHTTILGSHRCVIRPIRTGASHVAFSQSPGSTLDGIMLDGSDAPAGTIGLGFVTSSSGVADGGHTHNVFVANFFRPGSTGIYVHDVILWNFQEVVTDRNHVNFHIGKKGGDQTTTVWIGNSSFRSAITTGLWIESGQEITLAGDNAENNKGAGMLIDASANPGVISGLTIGPNTHFEANWLSLPAGAQRHAQYNLILHAAQDVALRDIQFQGAANDPKAAELIDVRDYVLDNVRVTRMPGEIAMTGANVGSVVNWPELNGALAAIISGRR